MSAERSFFLIWWVPAVLAAATISLGLWVQWAYEHLDIMFWRSRGPYKAIAILGTSLFLVALVGLVLLRSNVSDDDSIAYLTIEFHRFMLESDKNLGYKDNSESMARHAELTKIETEHLTAAERALKISPATSLKIASSFRYIFYFPGFVCMAVLALVVPISALQEARKKKAAVRRKNAEVRQQQEQEQFIARLRELAEHEHDAILLHQHGVIRLHATGKSIDRVILKAESLVPFHVQVEVNPGTLFAAQGEHQSMVSTIRTIFELHAHRTRYVDLPAACANAHKQIPNDNSSFSTKLQKADAVLVLVLETMQSCSKGAIQAAVWALTDGIEPGMMNVMTVTRAHEPPFSTSVTVPVDFFKFPSQPMQIESPTESKMISPEDISQANAILLTINQQLGYDWRKR